MTCNNCNSNETYIKEYLHKYDDIEFTSNRRFCSKCNNLVYDEELDNEASKKAIREKNKLIGLDSDKIIALRKKYNLTQEQFSKIIGCAKKALISYEQGTSIPNDIYLVTIKTLLENPEIIKPIIESNIDRYNKEEYQKIVDRLSDIYNIENEYIEDNELTEFNGYTEYSFDKIKNIILLLSQSNILKTKLLKELFYCDFISYKNIGKSITGLEYNKYPFGPVPNNYDTILNNLLKNNSISINIKIENDYEYNTISNIEKPNLKIFTKEELDIINKVISYFKEYTSKKIVDYSHKEKAFTETNLYEKISYDYSFDIEDI